MKVYKQIKNILSLAGDFHGGLADFYGRLVERTEKGQVRLLLEFLSRRERTLQHGLQQFEEDQQELGEIWRQYITMDEQLALEDVHLSTEASVDEVVATGMGLDNRLMNFYDEMARSGQKPPAVRDMFRRLIEQGEQEKAELAKSAEQIRKT